MNTLEGIILVFICGSFGFWLTFLPSGFQKLMSVMFHSMKSVRLNGGAREADFNVRPTFIRLFGVIYLLIFFYIIYMVLTGTQPNQSL